MFQNFVKQEENVINLITGKQKFANHVFSKKYSTVIYYC
jgi:hypothetical protein